MNQNKKYNLKPGKHQFVPKSPAVHDNENLSDEDASWYLDKYPHISQLFVQTPQLSKRSVNLKESDDTNKPKENQIGEISGKSVKS